MGPPVSHFASLESRMRHIPYGPPFLQAVLNVHPDEDEMTFACARYVSYADDNMT